MKNNLKKTRGRDRLTRSIFKRRMIFFLIAVLLCSSGMPVLVHAVPDSENAEENGNIGAHADSEGYADSVGEMPVGTGDGHSPGTDEAIPNTLNGGDADSADPDEREDAGEGKDQGLDDEGHSVMILGSGSGETEAGDMVPDSTGELLTNTEKDEPVPVVPTGIPVEDQKPLVALILCMVVLGALMTAKNIMNSK